MRTLVCTLKFKDGKTVSASVSSRSPQSSPKISYAGSVDRLTRRFATSDLPCLKALFGNLAKELGADLDIKEDGAFEIWAE